MARTTLLKDAIDPQFLADMISIELKNKLQVTQLYKLDRSLEGVAGSTITFPEWRYSGMATVVAENAEVPLSLMKTLQQDFTIKKIGKSRELTDENILSAYGDPMGETVTEFRTAIQDRIEQDGIELLKNLSGIDGRGTPFKKYTATGKLNYIDIVSAADLLDEEEQGLETYIIVGRAGALQIRTDDRFIDNMSFKQPVMATGVVGSIGGCKVIISNRIDTKPNPNFDIELEPTDPNFEPETLPDPVGANFACIVQQEPFTLVMKRDVLVETARIIRRYVTEVAVSQHYVVGIPDYRKIVALEFVSGK
jgi:N4-gp56 family major capsid protein